MAETTKDTQAGTTARPAKAPSGRSPRLGSGDVIREAAGDLFLERGYQGTSMDDIAAAARVSKQTIYTHFQDKEQLFRALVLGNAARVEVFAKRIEAAVASPEAMDAELSQLAVDYIDVITRPEVIRLRRLVIAESERFPDLARDYYEAVPQRVYAALTSLMSRLAKWRCITAPNPELAAHHFAWLVIGLPLDQGMFYGSKKPLGKPAAARLARAATSTFLAAYKA
jgi:TetR/AcrR family transcriptional repressor of mexJK operon